MDRTDSAEREAGHAGLWLMLGIVLLLPLAKVVLADSFDPDFFWHVRVAQSLSGPQWPAPLVDDLSFSSSKAPWTPYSWAAELLMKWVWDTAGIRGVVFSQALLEAGIVLFVGMTALERARCGPRPISELLIVASTLIAAFFSLGYLSFRPVLLALFFLAGSAWLLMRDRRLDHRSQAVWWVVLFSVVLANAHLYAVFLPLVVAARLGDTWSHPSARQKYLVLTLLMILGTLATPMLPGVISAALRYQLHDPMVASTVIAEMQPFWGGVVGKINLLLVVFIFACAIYRRRWLSPGDWAWLLLGLGMLSRLGRFGPVFAIFSVPVFATVGPRLSDGLLQRPPLRWAFAVILVGGFGRIATAFPTTTTTLSAWLNRSGPEVGGYPCGAADFVDAAVATAHGRLINEFNWGGYLEWRLGARFQVLLDGRTQVFPATLWQATYLGSASERRAFLSTLNADAAVLPLRRSRFHEDLIASGWKPVFSDEYAQVLLPPQSAHDAVASSSDRE